MENKQDMLVTTLGQMRNIVLHDGIETIIKPIPDSDVSGDLDPRVLAVIKGYAAAEPETSFDLASARASMGWPNRDVTTMDITTDHVMIPSADGDIPARLYRPRTEEALPAIVFFHGGGFFGGTLDTVENPCKLLAEKANALVVSVDYRLAPEHPFPAGLNDCYQAVEWVYEQADELNVLQDRLAVAGDSAGGNLATACCLLERSKGLNRIHYQALVYPVVNLGSIPTDDYEWRLDDYEIKQHHDLIRGVIMALGDSDGLLNHVYLQGKTELTDPLVSPLFAEDVAGLPPALLITAEYDYLRLEGEAYARKLARAGVKTRLIQYCGMDHAFMDKLGDFPQAEDCMTEIANGMKEMT
ncbi:MULTISPECIES: alpha/beta hydrolase [unclassified Exiguobacterium]|uniref:alpha/beta hydrolase n=1 Tax=unclassified Exiguobacterium TaxID=2644629 RepID=UPI001BEACD00|nr:MULTISPECIES: alpha/beta hydrolase [unclassified Exiguobacterium]